MNLRGVSRRRSRVRSVVETGVLAALLLTVVASTVAGSPTVLLFAVVGAWLALALMVGFRNVLDAGCAFMLVVVGVVLVVDLATGGPGVLP